VKRVLIALAATVFAVAVPASAADVYSLLDFNSAVNALRAVDPTIDPPPNDPSRDLAVGGFHGAQQNNVGVSAHSGPTGEDPNGHVSDTSKTFKGRFRVTCLAVLGNRAALGLEPTNAASNDQATELVLVVQDNRNLAIPDQYEFLPEAAASCPDDLIDTPEFFIQSGNILVHDALP
jgi:hypothetical protein